MQRFCPRGAVHQSRPLWSFVTIPGVLDICGTYSTRSQSRIQHYFDRYEVINLDAISTRIPTREIASRYNRRCMSKLTFYPRLPARSMRPIDKVARRDRRETRKWPRMVHRAAR